MISGYSFWLSRFFRRVNPLAVRRVRRASIRRNPSRCFQHGFTIPAMVENLEQRQLLSSGPTLNIGNEFQGLYNLALNGANHPSYAAADFSKTSLTFNPNTPSSQTVPLKFAFCVDIAGDISLNTNYNPVTINSTTVYGNGGPAGGPAPGYISALPGVQ